MNFWYLGLNNSKNSFNAININSKFKCYSQGKLAEVNDPSVYINPDQPLISKTTVSQDDVEKQEAKVNSTRARLAKALEALSG